jgi:hypothetical protein
MPRLLHTWAVRKFHGANGKGAALARATPCSAPIAVKHIILICPAVNHIDASALESLEAINRNLREARSISPR